MGRGRAPCCHKGHVNRALWSPEEDLRLTSFILKYGHGNWMDLPKQAGLLRCGKSCRLRWINYLRPDLKRGNFTKEEEETVIRLHQSYGNKWAMIAAALPGRTDNEVKNVWNTRVKKRLAQKPVGCREDVTTGSPVVTSSSSSTVESRQNYQITEVDCQINMLPHGVSAMKNAEMDSSRTTFALNQSSVANQVPGLQDTELSNKFGSTFQHSEQPLDSSGINQPEDSAMWEDPNFLEPLLDIDEDHDWVLPPPSTQMDSTENPFSHELLLVPDFDSCSMLNYGVMPAPAKSDGKEADKGHIVEAPMNEMSINAAHEDNTDKEMDSMFESLENEPAPSQIYYEMHDAAHEDNTDKEMDSLFESLENEPALSQIYNEMHEKARQYLMNDPNHSSQAEVTDSVYKDVRKKVLDSNIFKVEGKKVKEKSKEKTPCCDKSRVIRGPWSPAEDLRLISFIQNHGHYNWRALPEQAGLLRCGKSCRLRWLNYLRPGLKHGNFTKDEKKTIIQLHQSVGNKWSWIAANLIGRTDNEVKNFWNTHIKKRLAPTAGSSQDVTKGSSVITSPSSSSTAVASNQQRQKTEKDSQINILPRDVSTMGEMESSKTIFGTYQSLVANQVAGLQPSESLNKFGFISQHSEKLSDSSDNNQLKDNTMWEDPNFLDPLLNLEEDPNWELLYPNTQLDATENTSSHELRTEPDFDLWSDLNNDVIPAPSRPVDKEAYTVETPMGEESAKAARVPELTQYQVNDLKHISPSAPTGNDARVMSDMDYFPMRP